MIHPSYFDTFLSLSPSLPPPPPLSLILSLFQSTGRDQLTFVGPPLCEMMQYIYTTADVGGGGGGERSVYILLPAPVVLLTVLATTGVCVCDADLPTNLIMVKLVLLLGKLTQPPQIGS